MTAPAWVAVRKQNRQLTYLERVRFAAYRVATPVALFEVLLDRLGK
jgi:hypothetical protein